MPRLIARRSQRKERSLCQAIRDGEVGGSGFAGNVDGVELGTVGAQAVPVSACSLGWLQQTLSTRSSAIALVKTSSSERRPTAVAASWVSRCMRHATVRPSSRCRSSSLRSSVAAPRTQAWSSGTTLRPDLTVTG